MKFNIENYKGNYCMHCKTEEEAKDFCKYLDSVGRKWHNGDLYTTANKFTDYNEKTVYYFNEGVYGGIDYAKKHGYTILEWSDFMKEDFTKLDLKNGMIVEYANEQKGMFLNGRILTCFGYNNLRSYSEDLTTLSEAKEFNIERVYYSNASNFGNIFQSENLTLIWERNPRKKMTKEEIETALGYQIEIVEE